MSAAGPGRLSARLVMRVPRKVELRVPRGGVMMAIFMPQALEALLRDVCAWLQRTTWYATRHTRFATQA